MTVLFADATGTTHCASWDSTKRWIEIEDEIYLTWGRDSVILDVTSSRV